MNEVRGALATYFASIVRSRGKELNITSQLRTAADIAAQWLVNGQTYGLKIMGGPGTGKSTLLEAMRLLIFDYMERRPIEERKYLGVYQATQITDKFRKEDENSELFYRFSCLGIDDLGIEPNIVKYYGNEIMPMIDILHRRANDHLLTIVVTNLDEQSILNKYGPRVHDRMRDMTTIILDGTSNRG